MFILADDLGRQDLTIEIETVVQGVVKFLHAVLSFSKLGLVFFSHRLELLLVFLALFLELFVERLTHFFQVSFGFLPRTIKCTFFLVF